MSFYQRIIKYRHELNITSYSEDLFPANLKRNKQIIKQLNYESLFYSPGELADARVKKLSQGFKYLATLRTINLKFTW